MVKCPTEYITAKYNDVLSYCPDYQHAISGDDYMNRQLSEPIMATGNDFLLQEYMLDTLPFQDLLSVQDLPHSHQASQNKEVFIETIEINNAQFFDKTSWASIQGSYSIDGKAIHRILKGNRC